jgi:hypothetical protein
LENKPSKKTPLAFAMHLRLTEGVGARGVAHIQFFAIQLLKKVQENYVDAVRVRTRGCLLFDE